MKTKKCSQCKEEKSLSFFYQKKTENRYDSWCKKCVEVYKRRRWVDRKRKAIELLGGACQKCGYNKCLISLVFHHNDPKQKDHCWYSVSRGTWEDVLKEIRKCTLLCRNCHGEEHAHEEHWVIDPQGRDNRLLNISEHEIDSTGICPTCKKDVYGTKYCSKPCVSKAQRVVKRPSKRTLRSLLNKKSMVSIGKQYKVSDNTVRKWARQYELIP